MYALRATNSKSIAHTRNTASSKITSATQHSLNHSVFSTGTKTSNNIHEQIFSVQRRFYPRQPRIRIPFESPWEMLERYKELEENPPSLQDAKPMKVIGVSDKNVLDNIKILEELRAAGKTPGEEFISEAPELESIVQRIKHARPEGNVWTSSSQRVGAIGVKLGMLPQWDEYNQRLPLTAIWIPNCQVVQTKTKDKEGYNAVQVGAMDIPASKVTKPMLGHFQRAGVSPKHALIEFPVTEDAIPEVGTEITARHFVPGQYVDITGRSKGKGFQGPMKRWGFGGLPASHGVSLTHRSHGSTGQNKTPSRVFKGKKMAGHMGARQTLVKSLYVYMVDFQSNVIFVHGSVPGASGSYLALRDAVFKRFTTPPPFPTFVPPRGERVASLPHRKCVLRADGRKPGDWEETVEMAKDLLKRVGQTPGK